MPREEPIRTNTCLMKLPSTPAKNPPAVGVVDVDVEDVVAPADVGAVLHEVSLLGASRDLRGMWMSTVGVLVAK